MGTARRKKVERVRRLVINNLEEANDGLLSITQLEQSLKESDAVYNQSEKELREEYMSSKEIELYRLQDLKEALQEFAIVNRDEVFGDNKSVTLAHGEINFRISPPAVKTLKGWTQKTIMAICKKSQNLGAKFIRNKETLNKNEVLAMYASKGISDIELEEIGMSVIQEETFGYETNEAIKEGAA